jgi:hypothetical protein
MFSKNPCNFFRSRKRTNEELLLIPNSMIESLPEEVFWEILTRLSLKDLGRAACVNRYWNKIADLSLVWLRTLRNDPIASTTEYKKMYKFAKRYQKDYEVPLKTAYRAFLFGKGYKKALQVTPQPKETNASLCEFINRSGALGACIGMIIGIILSIIVGIRFTNKNDMKNVFGDLTVIICFSMIGTILGSIAGALLGTCIGSFLCVPSKIKMDTQLAKHRDEVAHRDDLLKKYNELEGDNDDLEMQRITSNHS